MNDSFELFPESASTAAEAIDELYIFLLVLSFALTLLVAVLVVSFAVKYRRGSPANRSLKSKNMTLEIIWIGASVPLLVGIFYWGARVAFFVYRAPPDAMQVTIVGKQWMWKVRHADGRGEINTLHVPVGRPVRLTMISEDVIHSFYVPAFRVKQDVLPGRYTSLWFEATEPGEYRLYCAEYCGTDHSRMVGRIIVLKPHDFSRWLAREADDESPVVAGRKLFEQLRCHSCHEGAEGQPRGPSLAGIYLKKVPLANGETVLADDDYLRESILRPNAKIVAGYQPLMPPFESQISEDGVLDLIAYIRSLGESGSGKPPAATIERSER